MTIARPFAQGLLATAALASVAASGCQEGTLNPIGLAPPALESGLIAHYTFDEGSGMAVGDSSGQNRAGVNMGGTWITDGRFLGAMRFDGFSTVMVTNFPFVNEMTGFSVSYWIRTPSFDAGPEAGILGTILSTEIYHVGGWELNLDETSSTGVHTSYWDTDAGAYTGTACACVIPGVWTHVASVFDPVAGTLSLYVNGTLTSSVAAQQPIAPGTTQLLMGHWFGPFRFLVGDLDDVAIYNRPLSAAEVAALKQQSP